LDTTDPFLRRNLSRLEARFRARYYSSVQKDVKRKKKGKPSHKTTLKSIEDNRKRLEEVIAIRTALFHKFSEKSPDRSILKPE
jgi:hypothetical protein